MALRLVFCWSRRSGILENHDCVSHFAPRPEYSINILLLPTGGKALDTISCFQKCTPQGGVTQACFLGMEDCRKCFSASYVFPPDSVKLLLGCGHPFSFLCTLGEWGNRGVFLHDQGSSQSSLETWLQISVTKGRSQNYWGSRRSGLGPGPKSWCSAYCLYIYLKGTVLGNQ